MNYSFSIGIPCHYSHTKYLQEKVDLYNSQSFKPNEIVVSISDALNEINLKSEIPLKIISTKERKYAGENRNIIMSKSNSDIVIFSDADDLPHQNRVESIRELFLRDSHLEVLLHGYACSPNSHHNFNDLKMEINDFFDSKVIIKDIVTNQYTKLHEHDVAHGALCIKKSILKKIEWTNKIKGQDIQFIEMCLSQGIKISSTDTKLYYYRNDFSSKAENLDNKNYLKKILKKLKL
mgnify:CR=1 FL=1